MATVEIYCDGCGAKVQKPKGEVNRSRKLGRRLFCGRNCSARTVNASRKSKEIVLDCPGCGHAFVTTTHNKAKRHCSRSCASKASMSEERREAQQLGGLQQSKNLLTIAEVLKRREAWKYTALREALTVAGRKFEFEFAIENRVFDLVLFDTMVLVEFDGPYHRWIEQQGDDLDKDRVAKEAGFTVVRRQVLPTTVIDPSTLDGL